MISKRPVSLKPQDFRDQVLAALYADDTQKLSELVEAYEPLGDDSTDPSENEALVAIGKFGYSGRTSRYKPFVHALLENGLQPELATCAYFGLVDRAAALVARDPRLVNALNEAGITPLHAAAERGDLETVTWLCEVGADTRKLSSDDELPIVRALHAGPWKSERALDVVDFLAPLCGLERQLWFAAGRGDTESVKSILADASTKVDEFDNAGETPLFHSCHNNQPEIVRLLLDSGADPNLATATGETPLDTACLHSLSQECDPKIITMLLQAGANETIEAAVVGENIEFIRSYAQAHPDALASNATLNPMYYAVHTGRARSLEALVELGARPDDELWKNTLRIFADDERLLRRLRAALGR